MNSGYNVLIDELEKPRSLRKGFRRKRKEHFIISDERINELYDRYFLNLPLDKKQVTIRVLPKDLDEILYLLRVHFEIWITIEGYHLKIFKEFPKRFGLIKEVNSKNHWYTPKIFPKGTPLYYGEDLYGVCNRFKGIPLSEIPSNKELNINRPVVQINYDFIEVVDDLF